MTQYFKLPFDIDTSFTRRQEAKRKRDITDDPDAGPRSERPGDQFPVPQHFPHQPLPIGRPPPRRPPSPTSSRSVKQQQITVLNTILHRCLLEHDWPRAGRALGLLLRVDYHGRPFDLRKHGLWGIGAEILLHKTSASSYPSNADCFTHEGFDAAKAYYDRLILQYPYSKAHPRMLSATTFYPAMFGLWIDQIQSQTKSAISHVTGRPESVDRDRDEHDNDTSASPRGRPHGVQDMTDDSDSLEAIEDDDFENQQRGNDRKRQRQRERLDIKRAQLREVRRLDDKINELTLTPPYDREPQMLRLQADVALWLADLLTAARQPPAEVESQRRRAEALASRFQDRNGTTQ